jgi:hypothetical protein
MASILQNRDTLRAEKKLKEETNLAVVVEEK